MAFAEHKIKRRRSKIHGNGVFAIAPIRKGERIVEYKGRLIPHSEADKRYEGPETGHTFLFILNDDYVIDGNRQGNIARWINTGCDVNAEALVHEHPGKDRSKDRVIIEATRSIKPGEEIIYDYGIVIKRKLIKAEREKWACHCGSPKCVGTMLRQELPK
jgi:SET domain-containing protein